MPTIKKRVVTCFGSSQLITALSVLRCREQAQQSPDVTYENYLVIYDLSAPRGQVDEFAALVRRMAECLCDWTSIVYINPEKLNQLKGKLNTCGPSTLFGLVHQLVGTATADEIYLCRNWTTGEKLLMGAYQTAEKICYGDGLGVYLPESYVLDCLTPTTATPKTERLSDQLQRQMKASKEAVKAALGLKTVLKTIEFDVGYFFLPNVLGEAPPMKTLAIAPEATLEIFKQLSQLLDPSYIQTLQDRVGDRPTAILLTANHAERDRMTVESEIAAYRAFLEAQHLPADAVLLIKPHPRDNDAKITQMKTALSDLFSDIILLVEPNLFSLPFEVFLVGTFLNQRSTVPDNLKIVTFSSACLSLELFFHAHPLVGFGQDIVTQYFYPHCVAGRLKHEADLQAAMQTIQRVPANVSG